MSCPSHGRTFQHPTSGVVPRSRSVMINVRKMSEGAHWGTMHGLFEGNLKRYRALPSRHNGSGDGPRMHDVFMMDPFIDLSRTIEADIDRIERRMERAMEQMQSPGREQARYGRKYTREWRDESAHSKTYFSESVTIMRPENGVRRASQHGMGNIGLVAGCIAAVTWYQGTKRFLDTYQYSTFSDDYRWKLALLWPFLLLTSPKFRREWENAKARSAKEALVKPPSSSTHDHDHEDSRIE